MRHAACAGNGPMALAPRIRAGPRSRHAARDTAPPAGPSRRGRRRALPRAGRMRRARAGAERAALDAARHGLPDARRPPRRHRRRRVRRRCSLPTGGVEVVAQGLQAPWSILRLPAGGVLVSERDTGERRRGAGRRLAAGRGDGAGRRRPAARAGCSGSRSAPSDGRPARLRLRVLHRGIRQPHRADAAHGRSRLPRPRRARGRAHRHPQGGQPQRRTHRVRPRRVPLRDGRRRGQPRRRAGSGVAVGQDPADDARRAARRPAIRSTTSRGRSGIAIRRGSRGTPRATCGRRSSARTRGTSSTASPAARTTDGRSSRGRPATRGSSTPSMQWSTAEASPSGLAIVGDTLFLAALRGERLWSIAPATAGGAAHGDAVVHGRARPAPRRHGRARRRAVVHRQQHRRTWLAVAPATTGCSGCGSRRPDGARRSYRGSAQPERSPFGGQRLLPTAGRRVYSHPMADLERVRRWAEALIVLHLDPATWSFGFDNAKKRAGLCNYTAKHISVSRYLAARYDDDEIHQILLHEVAHAMAGPRAGHGPSGRRSPPTSATSAVARTTARSRTSSRRGSGDAPRGTSISATVNRIAP